MVNADDAIKALDAKLKDLLSDANAQYKALRVNEREFEGLQSAWTRSHGERTGEWEYGQSASIRKLWPADLAAVWSNLMTVKADGKRLAGEIRETRKTLTDLRKSKKQAFRETNGAECQICTRLILAQDGRIAHHGYTRPGQGYQTRSCEGAMELPYETSCEVLKPYLNRLKAELISTEAAVALWKNNPPESVTVLDWKNKATTYTKAENDSEHGPWGREVRSTIHRLERDVTYLMDLIELHAKRVAEWTLRPLKAMTVSNF